MRRSYLKLSLSNGTFCKRSLDENIGLVKRLGFENLQMVPFDKLSFKYERLINLCVISTCSKLKALYNREGYFSRANIKRCLQTLVLWRFLVMGISVFLQKH